MKAAIIGGGVIGGGWAARFALSGWEVALYDPDPEAARKVAAVMAGAHAALLPSISIEVPRIDDADPGTVAALTHATRGINALGLPALSAPCGRDAAGLPIGFQLVARAWDEAALIRIADAYQRRTSWHVARPSLT